MKGIYDLSLITFSAGLRLLSGRSSGFKKLVEGRKSVFSSLKGFVESNKKEIAWFHVASLGEYEQAKPVIKELKKVFPDWAVAVSFFSPSGYEHIVRKKQPEVDFVTYLPFDTPANAEKFVRLLHPKVAFFVKYDLWANHIFTLKKYQIPLFLFSASFRKDQIYFKSYGHFFRKVLRCFDHIFTQNKETLDLLKSIAYHSSTLTGDTRYDNVKAISRNPKSFPELKKFTEDLPIMVIGSAWEEDMELIVPFINANPSYKYIIAPHDIHGEMIGRWQKSIHPPSKKYSELSGGEFNGVEVLFIDNIGMLSSLYQYAHLAYVGGAFGKGLHNILEPLAFGIPVLFGRLKKAGKFPEAAISQSYGCGFEVGDFKGLQHRVMYLNEGNHYQLASQAADRLVADNLGSAGKIMNQVKKIMQTI